MSSIADNLAHIRREIETAASGCGRGPSSVTLVAVSKLKPASMIREAFEAGQRAFGENYAQEMRDKAAELSDLDIDWHFIGHLQRNKAKYVAPAARYVETVDSMELADVLSRRATQSINCLIEVNIGSEDSKSGVAKDLIPELAKHIISLENLSLRGLMIIPPYDPDQERSRPYFKKLSNILADLNDKLKLDRPLTDLSMGMSHDFEVAIEEGATIVRVGTAIFGER